MRARIQAVPLEATTVYLDLSATRELTVVQTDRYKIYTSLHVLSDRVGGAGECNNPKENQGHQRSKTEQQNNNNCH